MQPAPPPHLIKPERVDRLDCGPAERQLPVYSYGQVTSTNQIAWELLAAGIEPPFAVTARCQSAGRGQWGRTWASAPGGLYVSAVLAGLPAAGSCQTVGLPLTLAVALGIATVLRAAAVPVCLKWPNDLLLANRKLGGILCQQRQRGQQAASATVIGVGMNWANAVPPPAIALQPWCDRQNRAVAVASLADLLQLVLRGIHQGCNRYQHENAGDLLDSYQQLLTSSEQPVTIGGRTGIVRGVAPDGRLRIGFPDTGEEILQSPGTVRLGYPRAGTIDP